MITILRPLIRVACWCTSFSHLVVVVIDMALVCILVMVLSQNLLRIHFHCLVCHTSSLTYMYRAFNRHRETSQGLIQFLRPISLDDMRNLYSQNVSLDYARTNIHPLVIHEDDISLRHLLAVLNPNGPADSMWNLGFNRKLMQIVLSLPTKARYVGKCA